MNESKHNTNSGELLSRRIGRHVEMWRTRNVARNAFGAYTTAPGLTCTDFILGLRLELASGMTRYV
jgi:hypothetical protein